MSAERTKPDDGQYKGPEIARVADAQEVTLGTTTPVTDRPVDGYYDASKGQREYPGEQLDV